MVRCYKRKCGDSKYSKEDVQIAIQEVRAGRMSIYKASNSYSIPYCTIYSHVKGIRGAKKKTRGRLTALSQQHEEELAAGIVTLEKWGFGLSKKEVLGLVSAFVRENKLKTPFKDGTPGTDWFLGFKKRHNLSIKIPQSVEYARKKATDPFIIYGYFDLLRKTLNELSLFDKATQIWNLDESSFSIDPSKTKVVGKKGKPCSRITSTPGRENTTVCLLASAAGEKGPPLIIFKGLNIWDQWQAPDDIFPGLSYAASKKGWMDSEIFLNYFKNTVIPALGEERPVLIIYDGHSTHVSTSVIDLAKQQNITIIKLPPHTTHLLQPLDLSVFKSVKCAWDQKLVKWQRHNTGRKLPKHMFSAFIAEIWRESDASTIINGFRKAGIVPFDNSVVSREKFDLDALKRWDAKTSEINANISLQTENAITDVSNNQDAHIAQPSTSHTIPDTQVASTSGKSFEMLLLESVRQYQTTQKIPKRKLASGAEVITAPQKVANISQDLRKLQKKTSKKSTSSSESDSDFELPNYQESDNDEEYLQELLEDELADELEQHVMTGQNIEVGKMVLVQYATKKTTKHFVGKIVEKSEDDDWFIKFLRYKNNKFIWPQADDIAVVESANIIKILPEPKEERRTGITFNVQFQGYNLC